MKNLIIIACLMIFPMAFVNAQEVNELGVPINQVEQQEIKVPAEKTKAVTGDKSTLNELGIPLKDVQPEATPKTEKVKTASPNANVERDETGRPINATKQPETVKPKKNDGFIDMADPDTKEDQ